MGQGTQRPETSPSNPTATSSTDVIARSEMQEREVAQDEATPATDSRDGEGAKTGVEGGASEAKSSSAPSASQAEGEELAVGQGGSSSSSSTPPGGAAAADPSVTNLHFFHDKVTLVSLPEEQFTRVKGWKKVCLFGHILRYTRKLPGQDEELTVVKEMKYDEVQGCRRYTRNDRDAWRQRLDSPEDALNEIGVYSYFREQERQCPYVLRMLGSFVREVTTNLGRERRIWLVLENCDGGDLFDSIQELRNNHGGVLAEVELKRYVWQILKAVEFLHEHNVGHRDISLENLLLRQGQVRLMDFGQAVLLRNAQGNAHYYFRLCGKDYYRAPEVYMPSNDSCPGLRVQAPVPEGWTQGREVQVMGGGYLCLLRFPDTATPGQMSAATLSGYPVAPVDVFACGVAMFILHAQVQPWKQALMAIPHFKWAYANGIQALLQAWEKPALSNDASQLLSGMLHVYSAHRWTIQDCLASPWFADVGQDLPANQATEQASSSSPAPTEETASASGAPAAAQPSDASAGYPAS